MADFLFLASHHTDTTGLPSPDVASRPHLSVRMVCHLHSGQSALNFRRMDALAAQGLRQRRITNHETVDALSGLDDRGMGKHHCKHSSRNH